MFLPNNTMHIYYFFFYCQTIEVILIFLSCIIKNCLLNNSGILIELNLRNYYHKRQFMFLRDFVLSHEKKKKKTISSNTASCKMLSCLLCTQRDLDRRHFPRKANKVFILFACEMRREAPIYLFVKQIPCKRRRHISALRELRLEILRGISTTIWDFVVHVGQGLRRRRVLAERQYGRAYIREHVHVHCGCIQCHKRFLHRFRPTIMRENRIWNIFGFKFAFS